MHAHLYTDNYPVISEHPHDVHLVLNDTKVLLRLNCRADVMGGEIRWERDEGVISEDTIIEQHGDLIMTNPKLEDAGFYRCIAINGSGYTYSSYAHVTFDGMALCVCVCVCCAHLYKNTSYDTSLYGIINNVRTCECTP